MGLAIRDRYNNPTTISTPFSVGSPDSTAPTVSITTPTDGSLLNTSTQTLGPVSGSASDGASGSGVSRVRVQVMRNWTGTPEYWNGSVWGASAGNGAYATLAAPDANGTLSWSLASGSSALPPAAQLPSGTYTLNAIAYDRFDNTTTASTTIKVAPDDSNAPTVSITTPSEGAALTSLPSITGTASDSGSGLTRVDVLLSRITTNGGLSCWTGSSWSGVQTYLSSRTEVGWTRSTNLPSGSNLIAGAYIISATAYNRYGNASTTATCTFGVVQSLDALIAAGDDTTAAPLAESAYAGKYIINSTGTNQVATASGGAGSPIDFSVKVHKYGGSDDVTFTAPALDSGWSAAYYDAYGNNVTNSVTGTGLIYSLIPGEEVKLYLKITPPDTAAINDQKELLIHTSTSSHEDVVKVVAKVREVGRPDLSLKHINDLSAEQIAAEADWVGVNPTTQNTLAVLTAPTNVERYAVRVLNTGTSTEPYTLTLSAPSSEWRLRLLDANGQELTPSTPNTWELPDIAGGASMTLTLEVWSLGTATQDNTTYITAAVGPINDFMTLTHSLQWLTKIQWSRDNEIWNDVAPNTVVAVEPETTFGLRGIKAKPNLPWADKQEMGPYWIWQNTRTDGDTVWLQIQQATSAAGEDATAYLGTPRSVKIRVLPVSNISLSIDNSYLLAGAGPAALNSTTVTVRVKDDNKTAIAGVHVRLKAKDANDAVTGQWNNLQGAAATAPQILTTDANGVATAVWHSGAVPGDVVFEAVVLDDADQPRTSAALLDTHTIRPYSRVELGQWNEVNGAWERQVKVSTWFRGQKVGGRSIALTTQVSDFEDETVLPDGPSLAPFDAATGTTDSNGLFTTTQRWNPATPDEWPMDYEIKVTATVSN